MQIISGPYLVVGGVSTPHHRGLLSVLCSVVGPCTHKRITVSTYLPTYLLACLPAYLPAYLTFLSVHTSVQHAYLRPYERASTCMCTRTRAHTHVYQNRSFTTVIIRRFSLSGVVSNCTARPSARLAANLHSKLRTPGRKATMP